MPSIKEITSVKNLQVKAVMELREKKARDETKRMIVEGVREVSLAHQAGIVFQQVYFSQAFIGQEQNKNFAESITRQAAEVFLLKDFVFEKIAFGHRNEGVLGVCGQPRRTLADLKLSQKPLIAILESVEKPGNLGAVLRTADAVGVDAVFICDAATDTYNPNVIRSSLGAIFTVPVIEVNPLEAWEFLRSKGITVCATLPGAGTCYTDVDLSVPLAVVMGSEDQGLEKFWVDHCDAPIYIPMKGKVDSLNVSVSAAIVLYEVIRQRKA